MAKGLCGKNAGLRLDPAPLHRQPVRILMQALQQVEVLSEPAIVIAGWVRGVAVLDPPRHGEAFTHVGLIAVGATERDREPELEVVVLEDASHGQARLSRMPEDVNRFGDDAGNLATLNVVRACTLAPKPVTDAAGLARRAEQVVASEKVHWHLYVAGLAHYRAGQYDQAVERLRESATMDPNWNARAMNYPALAMAYHRLGKADEAREALASAEKAIDDWTEAMVQDPVGTMPILWYDWLECRHFYHEAKQLLTGLPPPDDPRLRKIHERALVALSAKD